MNKKELRKYISEKKKTFSQEELKTLSDMLMSKIEESPVFLRSKTIMLYYSLPDEVCTHEFIEKWYKHKDILLPVVYGSEMYLRKYEGKCSMKKGAYNIYEPQGEEVKDLNPIDMIIIPGVAFDRKGNRLGRGKGYYDKFLTTINDTPKIGICFGFQLCETIPADGFDIPMDEVWTENGLVSKI